MKNLIRIFIFLVFTLTAVTFAYSQDNSKSQVEALKERIDEIQKQNEELIRKIQQENAQRINELQKRIDELEETKFTEDQPEKGDLDKKIETIVDQKIDSKTPDWINFGFSSDFPSYYRSRARFLGNSTFVGAASSEDEVFFADSRLSVAPQFTVSNFLSLRGQLDIARNIIWGGTGDELISDKSYEAPSPRDSFRGALVREVTNTLSGDVISPVDNDIDLIDIRSLYMVARVPFGEFWIGRQPFDWGMGIFNNAGTMPDQDLGSIVDRFEFDTAPLSLIDKKWEKLLFAFIVDRLSEGRSIERFDEGDGWDVGLALLYEDDNLSLGAYLFGIYQDNFALGEGITADLSPGVNWSIYASYAYYPFRFSFEFQNLLGTVDDVSEPLSSLLGTDEIDISAENISLATRLEYKLPMDYFDILGLEFGWSKGDDTTTPNELEGNNIFFNNAYTVDSFLFKHIIPTIYALEGSVINSFYLKSWSTMNLTESIYFTPQVIFAWVDERNALATDLFTPLPKVDRYIGTEIETTITWKIMDHLWFDLIGSVVVAGSGLDDLQSQRAFIEGAVDSIDEADPQDFPYAVQGRFIFTLDGIIDKWSGSSSTSQRAWFGSNQ